jgi:DNA-binding CsgD family transcriptional regulator
MRTHFLISLFILLSCPGFAQNTIGLPDVVNYPKKIYRGGLQNWDIDQDSSGTIYVANNEGLLCFDGRSWSLFGLPNRTIVRSVLASPSHRIYVGGQDELGYFQPDRTGRLAYHSLLEQIPKEYRSFGDVWDIVFLNNDVWFRCGKVIFKYSGNGIAAYRAPAEWGFMELANGKLYAQDFQQGLMIFENQAWRPVFSNNPLEPGDVITGLHGLEGNQLLICLLKGGVYTTDGQGLTPLGNQDIQTIRAARIYSSVELPDKKWGLATSTGGLFIIDRSGKRIQHYNRQEGLQNDNILCAFTDRNGNIWLGLDNGIDHIAYNSAIKLINPSHSDAATYTALIRSNQLYIGTSNGALQCELEEKGDLSFSQSVFQPIENSKGQVWSLNEINGKILMGHHEGAFWIEGRRAQAIQNGVGVWNFRPWTATFPTERILTGNYRGLQFFAFKEQRFVAQEILSPFEESSRYLVIDGEQRIWVSHPYHGIFRMKGITPAGYTWRTYGKENGLPAQINNHIFKIREQLLAATEKGVYRYNAKTDRFEADPFYQQLLGVRSIRYLQEDTEGNVWFFHEKTVGYIDRTGNQPSVVFIPELSNHLLSGFEFVYPYNEENIFLAGETGLYHINLKKYRQRRVNPEVQIRGVRLGLQSDSLIYGGFDKTILNERYEFTPPGGNIRFEYSTPPGFDSESLEYSYRLVGLDDDWSEWSTRTDKEFTNLRPRSYTFEVKVRNNLGSESNIARFLFRIPPPWYQSSYAWVFYFLLAGGLIGWRYRYQQNKFIRQQREFEEEQNKLKYIHELEKSRAESELIALRSQNLESEIQFKNTELATSAMHLVKKGELITRLKTELNQLSRRVDTPAAQLELKKMIRQLEEDDQIDQEWDQFAKHFDKVHSDFVVTLKAKHPDISPAEVKLCSFLRMNLSSKEIAQLLNISVRGVEISRYRLRKKLNLKNGQNLFDYLIALQSEE